MEVNKNSYTIRFAAIMVIIVAALLSSAAIGFKPYQSRNIELEKKQNILQKMNANGLGVDGVPQGVSKLPLNFGIKKTGNQISDSMSLYDHEL